MKTCPALHLPVLLAFVLLLPAVPVSAQSAAQSPHPGMSSTSRPAVTDDARIVEHGEVRVEAGLDVGVNRGDVTTLLGVDAAIGWVNRLETGAFFGIGRDGAGDLTLSNPGLELKLGIHRPVPGEMIGVALVWGAAFNAGQGGAHTDRTTMYVNLPLSAVNRRETLELHANAGYLFGLSSSRSAATSAHWGAALVGRIRGTDAALAFDVGSGDPRDVLGPNVEVRTGARYFGLPVAVLDAYFGLMPDYNFIEGSVETWGWRIGLGATIRMPVLGGDEQRTNHTQGGRGLVVPAAHRD